MDPDPEVAEMLAVHRRLWSWPWRCRCGRRLPCPARLVALDEQQRARVRRLTDGHRGVAW